MQRKRLAVFDLIRGYRHDAAAVLFAFDLFELDGEDLRRAPIGKRKRILAKLLGHPHEGIAFNEHYTGDGRSSSRCLRTRLRGHRVEAPRLAVLLGPNRSLGESQKPEAPAVAREAEEDCCR